MWNGTPYMNGMGGMFGFGHGLLWLVLLAVIVTAVYLLLRDRRHERSEDAALTALGTRYAKGEIARDEYLKAKNDLKD